MRSPFWLLVLPVLMASRCKEVAKDLPILDKAAIEVFLLHSPDVGAEYGLELEQGEVTRVDVYVYKPLDTGGNSNVSGATVRILMPNATSVALDEVEPGHYGGLSTDKPGLYFEERGEYQVVATMDDNTWSVSALAYVSTEITAPQMGTEMDPGTPVNVTVASPAEALVAVVFDEEGTQVYDTLPDSADALLELVDNENQRELTIEGTAFAGEHLYLLGVAGIERAEWRSYSDNVYTSLSVFASGSLDSVALTTMPLAGMAGMVLGIQGEELAEYGIEVPEQVQALLYGAEMDITEGLEEQPITGVTARLSWDSGSVDLEESADTDGLYEAASETSPDLAYQQGDEYRFNLEDGAETYRLAMIAPEPPTLNQPEIMSYHDPSEALDIACPAGRDVCFVVVLDGEGEVVYDDLPAADTVDQVFSGEQGTPGGDTITIPSSQFTAQGQLYAIGLVGMNQLGGDGWSDNLNDELVDMYIGTSTFTAVTTVQKP